MDAQNKMAVCSFIAFAGTAAWVIWSQSNQLDRLRGSKLALLDEVQTPDERKAEETAIKPVRERPTKNSSV